MKDSIPMSPLEKLAWFNLAVFAASVILYMVGVPLLAWWFHQSLSTAALPALGLFGVLGVWGFGSYFLYDRRRRTRVHLDERENLINQRAEFVGMTICWIVFVLLCMSVWAVLSYGMHQSTLPTYFLPLLVTACTIILTVSRSIAILMQYQRSDNDAD
jgi:uncharacterized ion transporter superfamily protein YfcC